MNVLKNRLFLWLVGGIALCVLIWIVGPLIAFGDSGAGPGFRPLSEPVMRIALIIMIIAAFALHVVWQRMKAAQNNAQLIEGMGHSAPKLGAGAGAAEVAELGRIFAKATARLKELRFGKDSFTTRLLGRQTLYELPWYLIVGAPGSGKTTIIEQSGLPFVLDERGSKKPIDGVGGTRNCKWWFTNDAVLLDTAGRYCDPGE